MSDLNILHAQNADLKSRVSDSGLACDSPASAPDYKDIEAFEIAMRGGKKDFPQSDHMFYSLASAPDRKEIVAFDIAMNGGKKDFPQSGLADATPSSTPNPKDAEASRPALQEGSQHFCEFPASTPQRSDDKPIAPKTLKEVGTDFSEVLDGQAKVGTDPQAQLSSLFSMVGSFNDVEAPVRVESPHAILSADDLNMLVERILVSAAKDGTQEVRLILNESVLAGTEIVLNRSLTGQLVVALHCTDASAFQTLVASQFDLKQILEEREASTVQVSVNIQQENSDAERRSRGYVDYDPTQPWNRDNA